ncbi:MAG: MFS transporter [Bryobacterales bacterium]|nr:MFS transporter [Bryobacterales bacterium]MDE0627357.1 MFS transporter [Bryobacterales bacterium]
MKLPTLTRTQWLICFVAALGFAFDIYELLMLPLIVRPALLELADVRPGTPEFNFWIGLLFFVPAVFGGVFGLLGGWLTDRLGRRSVLVWSILLYGFSAFAAGFATNLVQLLIFRCTTFIGVAVEFVAAIAWLAELFPEPKKREAVIGWTQAFSSIGGLLVTGAYFLANAYGDLLPEIYGAHAAWRYTLISGLIPAIPLMIIRPFLPESPMWASKKAAGELQRPRVREIFRPELMRTTVVTTIIMACSYGAAFGAIQHVPRIVPGLVADLDRGLQEQTVALVQGVQEVGGVLGRVLLAVLVVILAARRNLLRVFQVGGLIVFPLVFFYAATSDLRMLQVGILLAGLFTVAQFSFWGNYLPRVYPTRLRGTGESFAANIGGRMLGTFAAMVTTTLASYVPGDTEFAKLALAAGVVGTAAYAIGLVASFWLPEPGEAQLPE